MAVESRGPAVCSDSNKKEGKGEMTKTPISLQDLRRSLYVKAKAEPTWRFWGLYVHVCKMETLQEAYGMAKRNDGAPGIDGVTFEAIEESGRESFLKQIQDELVQHTYQPMRVRKKEIPKDGGKKVRVLSIPTIHACGLRQQRRSLEGGKHPCRCKMPQVIQSEDVYAIRQSNDVLTDVQAKAEKTVVPCPDGERMTKHHAVLVRLNLVA